MVNRIPETAFFDFLGLADVLRSKRRTTRPLHRWKITSWVVTVIAGVWGGQPRCEATERPRLVVVVSVDQLCQDYLVRFGDNFADEGFIRRVLREGASYTQC